MAPNATITLPHTTGVLFEDDNVKSTVKNAEKESSIEMKRRTFETQIVWPNVFFFGYLHLAAVYGQYLVFASAMWQTSILAAVLGILAGFGVTAGVHRLWAHRAYKANVSLRLFLAFCNCLAHQNSIVEWARDHRVHHKYSETDADPHNRKRGFFFAHVGWLLCRKRPEVIKACKEVDISDLQNDSILKFQDRYYYFVMPVIGFLMSTALPVYCWGESWSNAWHIATVVRYVYSLNITWCINSAAHTWGNRPYDRDIYPRENPTLAFLTLGDGWHNYHHVFPWDYKGSELGNYRLNFTTAFIDMAGKIGWASDFKTVPASMIKSRAEMTGDGSHAIWGWGDEDMSKEVIKEAVILHPKSN